MSTLYVFHGYIASGKTTFAKLLARRKNVVCLNHDDWMHRLYGPAPKDFNVNWARVTGVMLEMTREFLRAPRDVVWDWGVWHRNSPEYFGRDQARAFAKECGVRLVLYSLRCDESVALRRALVRPQTEQPLEITKECFLEKKRGFDPLGPDEEAIVIDTTNMRSPEESLRFVE